MSSERLCIVCGLPLPPDSKHAGRPRQYHKETCNYQLYKARKGVRGAKRPDNLPDNILAHVIRQKSGWWLAVIESDHPLRGVGASPVAALRAVLARVSAEAKP